MIAEARDNNWITGANPARQLSEQPERVKMLTRYEQAIKSLLATGIRVEPVVKEDITAMMRVQHESGLLTNDALLIAVAERVRVQAIASADKTFSRVSGITLYSPNDLNE
jgi:predicted nucleic acid-binding protein